MPFSPQLAQACRADNYTHAHRAAKHPSAKRDGSWHLRAHARPAARHGLTARLGALWMARAHPPLPEREPAHGQHLEAWLCGRVCAVARATTAGAESAEWKIWSPSPVQAGCQHVYRYEVAPRPLIFLR